MFQDLLIPMSQKRLVSMTESPAEGVSPIVEVICEVLPATPHRLSLTPGPSSTFEEGRDLFHPLIVKNPMFLTSELKESK